MNRLRAPPLPVFAAASLALHLAAAGVLRRARADRTPSFDPAPRTLAGETLEVDPAPLPLSEPAESDEPEPRRPALRRSPIPLRQAPADRRRAESNAAVSARPAVFGAAGDRLATDLATTLTRTFPQSASADPAWSRAPFGSAGSAEVAIVLDDQGRIRDTAIAGAPSAALRRGIERTLSLLAPRPFTARAAVTRLRISARVSRDDVHDAWHGDVFALSGGSFSGDLGSAFFALPALGGSAARRVDVELRLLP